MGCLPIRQFLGRRPVSIISLILQSYANRQRECRLELTLVRLYGLWQIEAGARWCCTYGHEHPFRILFRKIVPVLIQFGIKWGSLSAKVQNSPAI